MDDQIAISHIKQGDLNGLESLVQRYQARAVHAAYLIVYDRGLAEEVVQAAFLRVIGCIDQFDEERPFAPWFFRIVVNYALKLAKKQKRYLSLDEFDEPTVQLAHWLVDSGLRPEQFVEEKEVRENILNAIRCLPPEQRAVIVMRYFLDMSETELSKRMERPLSTIKWWLRDARKRLYDLMGNSR
jgi:RNA polymerase sigma-70 factor (ECF subfamily)